MSVESGAGGFTSRQRAILVGALVLAFLLRMEYLRELILTPFGRHLLLDPQWYDAAARAILADGSMAPGQAYFRAPLYPLFLAALYRISSDHLLLPRIVQLALGLWHAWLCVRIAQRTHDNRVATIAGVLAGAYGMFIYYEAEILTTALGTLLSTTTVFLLLEADRRDSTKWFGLAGVVLGMTAVTHATSLVLAPVAALWILGTRWRAPRSWAAAVLFVLGVVLPVGTVTLRNALVAGDPVLIASQGGINFFIGNNELSDGKSALAPGMPEAVQVITPDGEYRDTMQVAAQVLAERELGRKLSATEVSGYWYDRGFAWIEDHPKAAIAHFLRKLVFFWNAHEISNNRDFEDQARRFTPIVRIFLVQYAFLLPLGIFGIVRTGWRTRPRSLLVSLLVVYSLTIAAFFVCARFRQPAVAWLIPFAAAGAVALWEDVRRIRTSPRSSWTWLGVLAGLALVTNPTLVTRAGIAPVTVQTDAPFHRFNLAVLYEWEGNLDRAIAEYRETIATGVRDPRVHLNLGNLLARTGRHEEAREQYRRVLQIAPDFAGVVRSNLGLLAAQESNWEEAIRQFEECLDVDAANATALVGLATAYLSAGRLDDSILMYRKALASKAGPEGVLRRSLSVAYFEAGLLKEAETEALAALRVDPNDVIAVLALGRVYASEGRHYDAREAWARARRIAPGVPAVERAIDESERLLAEN